MASRETELTHRQRHPCSLGPCLLTPAPREGGPCFPCPQLQRLLKGEGSRNPRPQLWGSVTLEAWLTPGDTCHPRQWRQSEVDSAWGGGGGGRTGKGRTLLQGPPPPAGSRRHHKQPPHRSLCTGLSSSRATPVQSTSPPAQQTDDICRRQTRTKLLSPRISVTRRMSVSAVSF